MRLSLILAYRVSEETLIVFFNPLSANSDENKISLYIFNTCSNIQVIRIKELITKDKMS